MHRATIALFACGVLSTAARAQQPATTPLQPPGLVAPDSAPSWERPNGALLHAGTSVYQLTMSRGGQTVPMGQRTVQITDVPAVGGAPGWLIAENRTGTAVSTSDSLWVAQSDLTPNRWVATIDRAQLGASFSRDSVFGAVQSYLGRSSFAAAIPPGALITPGMIDRLVELLPLGANYHASASLLLLDYGTPRAIPAEIRVERDESVHVGATDAACWIVLLRAGAMEQRMWVTKDAPHVVRIEQSTSAGLLRAELLPAP